MCLFLLICNVSVTQCHIHQPRHPPCEKFWFHRRQVIFMQIQCREGTVPTQCCEKCLCLLISYVSVRQIHIFQPGHRPCKESGIHRREVVTREVQFLQLAGFSNCFKKKPAFGHLKCQCNTDLHLPVQSLPWQKVVV